MTEISSLKIFNGSFGAHFLRIGTLCTLYEQIISKRKEGIISAEGTLHKKNVAAFCQKTVNWIMIISRNFHNKISDAKLQMMFMYRVVKILFV